MFYNTILPFKTSEKKIKNGLYNGLKNRRDSELNIILNKEITKNNPY